MTDGFAEEWPMPNYRGQHACGDECCCPEHGDMMFYSPGNLTHACVHVDCRYAHGYEPVLDQEIRDARQARRDERGRYYRGVGR